MRVAQQQQALDLKETGQLGALATGSLVNLFCTLQDWADPAILGQMTADIVTHEID